MDMQGWIEMYERKTGEKFIRKENFKLLFLPDAGFCEIGLYGENKSVNVYRVCGDIKVWKQIIESIAQLFGFNTITAIIIRKMKPFIRLWGGQVTEEEEGPLGKIYKGIIPNGTFECYPIARIYNRPQYIVIMEVKL